MIHQNAVPRLLAVYRVLLCAALAGVVACADAAAPVQPPPNDITF
jgi:hypothetical protein